MAVQWRCPACHEVMLEMEMVDDHKQLLKCHRCDTSSSRQETLCPICDARNPWKHRDTLHFLCVECGNTQTWYSHLVPA